MSIMTETMDTKPEKQLKGWHVLLIMMAFFGVMFAVNGVFLYHAITSFPGEDVKKSYVQGLNYNQTLEARAAQATLGWTAEAGIEDDKILFRLMDRDGRALSGYPVIAELRRMTTDASDALLTFAPGPEGTYIYALDDVASGQWRLTFQVLDLDTETTLFTATKTLRVK